MTPNLKTLGEKMAAKYMKDLNDKYPLSPDAEFAQSAFEEGFDAAVELHAGLVEALYEAKDVIDFCYMNLPKNIHQASIDKTLEIFRRRVGE